MFKHLSTSVAMAIYEPNLAFLRAQIESILSQSHKVSEIVISDDRSAPATFCEVEKLIQELDPGIKLRRNSHRLGYGDNFVECLKQTMGEIIFFSDQDDCWFPNKVERILNHFACSPSTSLVIHDLVRTNESLLVSESSMLDSFRHRGSCLNRYVYGSATAIRRRMVPLALEKPAGIAHDNWLHSLGIILNTRTIVQESLSYYRRHEDAVIQQRQKQRARNTMDSITSMQAAGERRRLNLLSVQADYALSQALETAIRNRASEQFGPAKAFKALDYQARSTGFLSARMRIYLAEGKRNTLLALIKGLGIVTKRPNQISQRSMRLLKDFLLCIAACDSLKR